VTIDALGCQKEVAPKVIDHEGHYVLAVKGNQGTLHDDLQLFWEDALERDFAGIPHDHQEQTEKGHGRLETRKMWCTSQIQWLPDRHDWPGLRSIAVVDHQGKMGDQTTCERRYFISSHSGRSAQRIAMAVRNHWCVENERHWSLDLCFHEDPSRARIGSAAENLSRLRRLALTLLKQDKTAQVGIKGKRLLAGWDEKYLLTILGI